jgi:SAM-dependent methyltransferase
VPPTSADPRRVVADGYDRIAEGYLRWRSPRFDERDRAYLDRLTDGIEPGARVLDLGCGAAPSLSYLHGRFRVCGVDISRGQLELARRLTPEARLVLGDMSSLMFRPSSFAAAVALYSVIHVPREQHEAVLRSLHGALRPGGRLLVVLGCNAWEGVEDDWLGLGATMWWSHFGEDESRALVERAGFAVLDARREIDDDEDARHLFVLAEKPR